MAWRSRISVGSCIALYILFIIFIIRTVIEKLNLYVVGVSGHSDGQIWMMYARESLGDAHAMLEIGWVETI
ncbi:MAG: hypothetical protein CL912_27200 [Deltaproteobacteria bacterium]|nr:hypothetical protein [Deltaproteobacteria bacterium]